MGSNSQYSVMHLKGLCVELPTWACLIESPTLRYSAWFGFMKEMFGFSDVHRASGFHQFLEKKNHTLLISEFKKSSKNENLVFKSSNLNLA